MCESRSPRGVRRGGAIPAVNSKAERSHRPWAWSIGSLRRRLFETLIGGGFVVRMVPLAVRPHAVVKAAARQEEQAIEQDAGSDPGSNHCRDMERAAKERQRKNSDALFNRG